MSTKKSLDKRSLVSSDPLEYEASATRKRKRLHISRRKGQENSERPLPLCKDKTADTSCQHLNLCTRLKRERSGSPSLAFISTAEAPSRLRMQTSQRTRKTRTQTRSITTRRRGQKGAFSRLTLDLVEVLFPQHLLVLVQGLQLGEPLRLPLQEHRRVLVLAVEILKNTRNVVMSFSSGLCMHT